jgi:adenylosuccinate lyase
MLKNLNHAGGVVHSGRVLLALTQKDASREDAYRIVQANAMRALKGDGAFRDLLKADPEVARRLSAKELDALFDLEHHFAEVDTIFARVFSEVRR